MSTNWYNPLTLGPKKYICGFCAQPLSSEKGYYADNSHNGTRDFIFICHNCKKPTYFDFQGNQTPGVSFGNDVNNVTDEVILKLYNEARKCTSQNAFTSAVLSCRKLLMHIAVANGAEENLKFEQYVQFLSDKGYIPPNGKDWVDHIRKKGNEANHEIVIMKKEDAEDLITFIEMLLRFIYEFPAKIKKT